MKLAGQAFVLAGAAPACVKLTDLEGKLPDRMSDLIKNTAASGVEPLPPTRIYPVMPDALVGLADTSRSIEQGVREAVEAAGGLDEIEPGQRVVIKPNMVAPTDGRLNEGRLTTNPEVLRAVIRLVKERGAHPIVGDRPAYQEDEAYNKCGFARVCMEEGATFFPWAYGEYVTFKPGKRHWSEGFRIPKILVDADHFINVPMLKNHELTYAEFTCCLKAFVGVCHPEDRWQGSDNALHQRNIGEKIAELNLSVKPLINIVDATWCMPNGGPDGFSKKSLWVNSNLIVAGKDRVACDSVALAVLKLYGVENGIKRSYVEKSVWDQVQIYYAAELGIGQADPSKISLEDVGVSHVDEIKANWI